METISTTTSSTTNQNNVNKKKLKLQKKKDQKKRQKQQKKEQEQEHEQKKQNGNHIADAIENTNIENIEKVSATDDFVMDENDPAYELFSKLVKHFDNPNEDENDQENDTEKNETNEENNEENKEEVNENSDNSDNSDSSDNEKNEKKVSNKERKRQRKLHLPILKQLVDRPDVVELHDVNSPNPGFLISLKSYRNSIPVPAHWCQKKKYLQGKRGFVKPPFELPAFIAATGITKIREAILEKEKEAKSKQKQRERVQPKLRRMGIDYEVLRDAFFVHQTKPNLTQQGDLYYEGKEFEVNMKNKKPGVLSDELKRALGMIEGYPPPWLIYMQTYGPPPSYPNLKIPGVNAPIPEGAQYGFHPGGWGRPVLNEFGKPLYESKDSSHSEIPITREYWGELLPEPEDTYEEEQQEEDEQQGDEQGTQEEEQYTQDYEDSNSGISSVPNGLETPDVVNIKKSRYEQPASGQPKELYQVIEQQNRSMGGGLMESSHRYAIPSVIKTGASGSGSNRVDIIKSQRSAPVEVTFNPSEIENGNEIDEELLKKKYEQATQSQNKNRPKEDISDIIEEQNKKRKNQQKDEKQKKFKF
ncbi:hypothetical protein DICPUDRAFT_155147 [Dictyostelium purpureum]|uniref:PSP proline-rich domain-containing protein n=1 Tax=Dictyostelium purpureum TaxID=5786 RepID=F0ZT70_DICPU|nr:uncharacterized protein DICPUDRAFT_155147 [Dictyostelium purpureum]EGC32867.1 hypothetical protein DICPUDRAFT_155147 [Dictyostelium purpureum]|eukprot:XP_003290619.1 hypothetical protein DICPUDRAFT_155147 [Dictyostelium purpureum]